MKAPVTYQLHLEGVGQVDEIPVEFDTHYSMPGHPFIIRRDGADFCATGEMELGPNDELVLKYVAHRKGGE